MLNARFLLSIVLIINPYYNDAPIFARRFKDTTISATLHVTRKPRREIVNVVPDGLPPVLVFFVAETATSRLY